MKLRISNSDPNLLVDDMGEPMFRFVGLHPSDVTALISELNEIDDLRDDLVDAEDKLTEIRRLL